MKLMLLNRKWIPRVQFFSLIVVALYPYDIIIIIILILLALQRPFFPACFTCLVGVPFFWSLTWRKVH